jgi:hypothetical protein
MVEIKNQATDHDASDSACDLLNRIQNSAVAIRRQQLQKLKQYGATNNDQAYEDGLPRIGYAKHYAENAEGAEMFKAV